MRRFAWLLILLFAFQLHASAISIAEVRKSLIRITNTSQEPNYRIPWTPGQISGGTGAGFIIDGKRIVTNAHVVSNARFLWSNGKTIPSDTFARVQFVAHDCDLAVLTVSDPKFFDGTVALPFTNEIPPIESSVSVYGYPSAAIAFP